jgi:prepilin-type N-terminal cleavage/methylation domain-containing protein
MKRNSGFTLIELLVVIAIIAILAAILFPVFAQAREKGRQASCMSNLKQLGNAMLMYSQDFDETYPTGGLLDYGGGGINYDHSWPKEIVTYVKTLDVFRCPSDGEANPGPGYEWVGPGNGISYTVNAYTRDYSVFGQPAWLWVGPIAATATRLSPGHPARIRVLWRRSRARPRRS